MIEVAAHWKEPQQRSVGCLDLMDLEVHQRNEYGKYTVAPNDRQSGLACRFVTYRSVHRSTPSKKVREFSCHGWVSGVAITV